MRRFISSLQAAATTLGVAVFYVVPFVLAGMSYSPIPEWEMDVSYGTRDASFVHVTLESIRPKPPPEPPAVEPPPPPQDRSSARSIEETAEDPETEAEVLTSVSVPGSEAAPILEAEEVVSVAEVEEEGAGAESAGDGKRRRRRKCLEPTDAIQQTAEGRFVVERTLVDRYARNVRLVKNLARARWYENDDGERTGFRVRRIRCGSVLYEAGLRNGDVVHAINGHTILSLAQAIPLWWNLRGRDRVLIRLTRQGETMRLRYRLV